MKKNKIIGLLIITLIYIVGIVGSFFLHQVFTDLMHANSHDKQLIVMLIIDVILTIYIFIFSLIFRNSSIYDPYWSVVPILLIIIYASYFKMLSNIFVIILICIISFWGVRLTLNWVYTFKNLGIQDFRYEDLKQKHPRLWLIINLFGIHLVPTIVVFIGMMPAFLYVAQFQRENMPTLSTWLGAVICVIAVIIEAVADCQMHHFKKDETNKGKVINIGLWKRSRHPNYFGEILFWFGICMMGISFYNDQNWILIMSPIIVLLLFVTISIPLMEKRQLANKPDYKAYKESTNMLLPLFNKKDSGK